ncbi:hypothetical protein SLS58_008442 [Diplodia intermedia]|uniref:Uncharacterized protein n=1 Tax=Diplodia intermedia TaxID=856260 RepID=A0ABR3TI09_9PEZI
MASITNSSSPVAGMPYNQKLALVNTNAKITIKWIDEKTSEPMMFSNVPKAMLLAFSPSAKQYFATSPKHGNMYNLGTVSGLSLGAVQYIVNALMATCRANDGPNALLPAAFTDATDVLRHLKCLAAAKKLGLVRCVQYVYRGAAMDAVRAAGKVTGDDFDYFLHAFGSDKCHEPMLLRHIVHVVVFTELTDEEESPDTLHINKVVTSNRDLAIMKREAEVEVHRKLTARKEMEEKRAAEKAAKQKSRLDYLDRKAKREAAQQKREAAKQKARNGERALSEAEIDEMSKHAGPRTATVSHKLR